MYFSQGYAGVARRRYAAVDASSKVEGATPHQLVKILFDELLLALDAAALAERNGDRVKASDKQARAISILHGLEGSLDFEKGGDIAAGLSRIYREARRLVLSGAQDKAPEHVAKAREIIAEIAGAWEQIG